MATALEADALIVGAGPAGCSCALWLALQGIPSILIEKEAEPLALLRRLDLEQDWVLGEPGTSTRALGEKYAAHIRQTSAIRLFCSSQIQAAHELKSRCKRLQLRSGVTITAPSLVLATGLKPRPWVQAPASDAPVPWHAEQLTRFRASLRGQRVLLLGGGDNAVENALYLAAAGNSVLLWSRDRLRAQAKLQTALQGQPNIEQRVGQTLPRQLRWIQGTHWQTECPTHGRERFDHVAALFGFEPNLEPILQSELFGSEYAPDLQNLIPQQARLLEDFGIFFCGDLALKMHPCIPTALGDGADTSRRILQWLQPASTKPRSM